jgi:hypothetical protein
VDILRIGTHYSPPESLNTVSYLCATLLVVEIAAWLLAGIAGEYKKNYYDNLYKKSAEIAREIELTSKKSNWLDWRGQVRIP